MTFMKAGLSVFVILLPALCSGCSLVFIGSPSTAPTQLPTFQCFDNNVCRHARQPGDESCHDQNIAVQTPSASPHSENPAAAGVVPMQASIRTPVPAATSGPSPASRARVTGHPTPGIER